MIKQSILVGAIALAAAGVASADGFYVGGQIGGTALHVKDTTTNAFNGSYTDTAGVFDGSTVTASTNGSSSVDAGNIGVQGGLLAGYGWTFPNQFYLGAEAFGNATSAKVSRSGSETFTVADHDDGLSANGTLATSANVKLRYNYGVRVLPGYAITPDTTAYAILGYVRGNFRATSTDLGSATFNANGYQLGLGAMTNVAKNVAVRGDFVYSGYASKTYTLTSSTTQINANTATGSGTFGTKLKPSTMEANLAVVYKFG